MGSFEGVFFGKITCVQSPTLLRNEFSCGYFSEILSTQFRTDILENNS